MPAGHVNNYSAQCELLRFDGITQMVNMVESRNVAAFNTDVTFTKGSDLAEYYAGSRAAFDAIGNANRSWRQECGNRAESIWPPD